MKEYRFVMKRYILCFVTFSVLFLFAAGFFTGGIVLKDTNKTAFICLMIVACLCFLSGIVIIGLNFKYLLRAETMRGIKKLSDVDYTSYKADVDLGYIRSSFVAEGFLEIAKDNFLKKTYDFSGDAVTLTLTHILLRQIDGLADIDSLLRQCRLCENIRLNYPVFILFIQSRFDENAKKLKDYTVEALAFTHAHPLSDKQYFYPILIHEGRVYCIKTNDFAFNFKPSVRFALKVLKTTSNP